jgi:hypothetical protein
VHLQTHAVDGDAARDHPADELVDRVALATATFGAEVVVEQLRVRVGGVGQDEGAVDVVFTDQAAKDRVAPAVTHGVVGVGHVRRVAASEARRVHHPATQKGFVDDVVSVDAPPVTADHGGDVPLHRGQHLVTRGQLIHPVRQL